MENPLLVSISSLDLEFLFLGYQKRGSFNEKDIEKSELARLGVGRVLDTVASLKDRKMITQNNDGSFTITNNARQILWNDEIPLWVKILRLLEIKAFPQKMISQYLGIEIQEISQEIEKMRKNELVLMSALRTKTGLEKMFEIMPTGIEQLEKINSEGFDNANLILKEPTHQKDVFELIDEIKQTLESQSLEKSAKQLILEKLEKIKEKLKI